MSPATLSHSTLSRGHQLQGLGQQTGKMLVIILIVVAVLLAAGGGAAWYFLSGGEDTEEGAEGETTEEVVKGPAIYHAFDPAFVVNLSDGDSMRFLQVELQVMTRDEEVPPALGRHEPVLRNDLLLLFGSQDYKELETREGRLNLQQASLNEIIRVLDAEGEPSAVEAVYFTSFVMQ